jgi:hypothetical protein
MLQLEREVVRRENMYMYNEIENRRLDKIHMTLNSLSLTATLIFGLNLSHLNQDNIVQLADDQSKFCSFKQPLAAGAYVCFTCFSMGSCITTLALSVYLIVRSQKEANEVSVTHTVALLRRLKQFLLNYFIVGIASFFIALLLLLWRYLGHHNWIVLEGGPGKSNSRWASGSYPASPTCPTSFTKLTGNPSCDNYVSNAFSKVVQTNTGQMLIGCLNPFNQTQIAYQRRVGEGIAIAATCTCALVTLIGGAALVYVKRAFRAMIALPEVRAMAADGSSVMVSQRLDSQRVNSQRVGSQRLSPAAAAAAAPAPRSQRG